MAGGGFSVVDAAAACVVGVVVEDVPDGGPSFETVVPAPPEALTDDVGPSPEVVVVVCVPVGVLVVFVSVVVAVVLVVVDSDAFDPVSGSVEPAG